MKIMVAAVAFSSGMTGVQRHAFNVVRCLLALPEITVVHLVVAPWQQALAETFSFEQKEHLVIHIADTRQSTVARNLWYGRTLPQLAAQQQVDLVHLAYPAPVEKAAYPMPIVVTLHDLYPYEIPNNFGFSKVVFNRVILRRCLDRVDGIASVSQVTLARLGRYLPSSLQKAVHISNCVTPSQAAPEEPSLPNWKDSPFLLCIAQHRRNKNIMLLLQAFLSLINHNRIHHTMRLLIIGIPGPETQKLQHTVQHFQLSDRVTFINGLSEAELQWCYAHCESLVAPSITEGFGLPVAEALLAGCRIVCSDIPAFREVGDGHCRFVPLKDNAVQRFADAIAEALLEPRPAPVDLPQLSINELAAQYLSFYRRCIAAALPSRQIPVEAARELPG